MTMYVNLFVGVFSNVCVSAQLDDVNLYYEKNAQVKVSFLRTQICLEDGD